MDPRDVTKSHHLIRKAAWENPKERELLERFIEAGDTVEIVKMFKGYTPDSHGHLHTHNAGTDQEYDHEHGHDHAGGLHADGKPGDHQHDHVGVAKGARASTTKASPVVNQTRAGGRPASTRMDVEPPSSMASTHHSHLHSHNDDTGSYQHEHPHDHPVRHSASDEMDSDLHDHHSAENKAARLRRVATWALEHEDPLIRQGGRDLSKLADAAQRKLITKSRMASTGGLSPELVKSIRDGVAEAFARAMGDSLRRL